MHSHRSFWQVLQGFPFLMFKAINLSMPKKPKNEARGLRVVSTLPTNVINKIINNNFKKIFLYCFSHFVIEKKAIKLNARAKIHRSQSTPSLNISMAINKSTIGKNLILFFSKTNSSIA